MAEVPLDHRVPWIVTSTGHTSVKSSLEIDTTNGGVDTDTNSRHSLRGRVKDSSNTSSAIALRTSSSSVPSKSHEEALVSNLQMAALCWCMLVNGWNDGSAGPLIPRMQAMYHVCTGPSYRLVRRWNS